MSKQKIRFSEHAKKRFLQRTDFKGDKKQMENYLKNALRKGQRINELSEQERIFIKRKLKNNLHGFNQKVVKHRDLFFIFNSNNTCITVFPKQKDFITLKKD